MAVLLRLVNMYLAELGIIGHDINERAKVNDLSKSCLGILRKNDWCNGVIVGKEYTYNLG